MLIGFLDYKHREKTEDLAWFSLFVRKLIGGFKHGQELVSSVCVFLASVQNDTAKIRRHDQSAKLLVVYYVYVYIYIYIYVCTYFLCPWFLAHDSTDLGFVLAGPFFRKAAENQMKRQQNELAQSILEARFAKTSSCLKLSSPSDTATLSRQRSLANGGSCPTTSHSDPSLLQSYQYVRRVCVHYTMKIIEVWWKSHLKSL